MTKRRHLNVLSFECVIFLSYVDVNRKFFRRKTNVNVKLFFITFSEFYTSYLFFILKKNFIVVENMIQIFMTFASWRKRKIFRLETNMQMKTLFIIHFDFCVNASFFEKHSSTFFIIYFTFCVSALFFEKHSSTFLITHFSFCVNASFFEKSSYLSTTWLFEKSFYLLIIWWKDLDKTDCVNNFVLWTK
jgi:hypothetical protein